MNILITSASNKVWLIQAFKQALMKNGGGQIYAADINKQKIALYYADQYFIVPQSNVTNFIPEIIKLCLQENIKLIIPTRDGELNVFAENKELLEKNNIKVMVANPLTISICQDKYQFYQYCIKHHFDTIKTTLSSDISGVEFPVFIKPRYGSGSENNYIAHTPVKLDQFLKLYDKTDFVIQPVLETDEYTIDLFSDFNGNVISVIPRQRVEVHNGESLIAKTEINQVIIEQASRLAKSLQLIGHNSLQCFYEKQNEQITFIEVNPRYGGGADLGFSAGVLTPDYLIKLMNGKELKPICGNDVNEAGENKPWVDELWMFKYAHQVSLLRKNNSYCENSENNKVYCIDIDGTICTEFCQYEDAKPVKSVIKKINNLYKSGHKIILFTSRGYSSGYNWMPLLKDQMESWGVQYHEIKQGKPFADYYIDNKAINVFDWF